MSSGGGNKSEKPTQRRLDKARKEGQFPASREVPIALQMMLFAWLVGHYGAQATDRFIQLSRVTFEQAFAGDWTAEGMIGFARVSILPDLVSILGISALLPAAVLVLHVLSTGFGFASKKALPDVSRLNPGPRLKQMPAERLQQFGRNLVMLPIVAWAIWHLMSEQAAQLLNGGIVSPREGGIRIAKAMKEALWFGALILGTAAALDFLWRRYKHTQSLKMTKQEIKDEHKESEGSPEIKMRIRRLQRDFARRNMMKEIPAATAVIVNPTHYAVAIRYSLDSHGAPKVVAKGKNYLALRIRQRAIENNVPIVENKPLAQALYKGADVGQEIPAELYRAVAEVLAYIFKLTNGKQAR